MANKPTPAPKSKEVAVEMAVIDQTMAAANQLAVATLEQNERVNALALQLNYQGSTDPAVLVNSAKDAIRRIGMAVFELGAYLSLLKEGCAHGDFISALEDVGISHPSAKKYMAITRRFANGSTSIHLEKLGFSKMAELLPLEDDSLEELLEQEGGMDAVERMSVRALRAAVREAKAEAAAKDQLLEDKNKRIDKLHAAQQRIQSAPPDEVLADLKREATAMATEAEGMVLGRLRHALIALNNHGDERGQQAVFMAGLLGQVQRQLNALREEFGLPDAGANTTPEWQQWADQQGAAPGTESVLIDSAH